MVRTLASAKHYRGTPTQQKLPLTVTDLVTVSTDLSASTSHDDLLFHAQLNTGFAGLLRLGELTWPDTVSLRDYKKSFHVFLLKIYPLHILLLATNTQG